MNWRYIELNRIEMWCFLCSQHAVGRDLRDRPRDSEPGAAEQRAADAAATDPFLTSMSLSVNVAVTLSVTPSVMFCFSLSHLALSFWTVGLA